jgi:hypothetical protein
VVASSQPRSISARALAQALYTSGSTVIGRACNPATGLPPLWSRATCASSNCWGQCPFRSQRPTANASKSQCCIGQCCQSPVCRPCAPPALLPMMSPAPRSCHPVSGFIVGSAGPAGICNKAAARSSSHVALPKSCHQPTLATSNCSTLLVPLGAHLASSCRIHAKVFRFPVAACSASHVCQPSRLRTAAATRWRSKTALV